MEALDAFDGAWAATLSATYPFEQGRARPDPLALSNP